VNGDAKPDLLETNEEFQFSGGAFGEWLDGNGTLWNNTGTFGSGTWQHVPNAPFPVLAVSALDSTSRSYVALKTDHTIWYWNGTTLAHLPGAALKVASDPLGTIYVIGTDNNVYHWNGSSWEHLVGSGFTTIAYGNYLNVWAVGPLVSGTTVYRMSEIAFQHIRTLGGTTSCSPTCPGSPIYHVANEQAAWKVNGVTILGNSATSGHVLPSANVNVSTVANLDEPFLCFFESDVCLPVAETETVSCSQVGRS
jgi:hypothetical protein